MLHSTWTAQRVLYRDEAKQRWRRRARVRPIFIAHKHSAVALRRVGHSTTCACNRRDWQRLNERSAVCVRAWICRGSSDSSKSSSSLARSIDTPVSAVRPSTSHRTRYAVYKARARRAAAKTAFSGRSLRGASENRVQSCSARTTIAITMCSVVSTWCSPRRGSTNSGQHGEEHAHSRRVQGVVRGRHELDAALVPTLHQQRAGAECTHAPSVSHATIGTNVPPLHFRHRSFSLSRERS
jgi:hypothetical protein